MRPLLTIGVKCFNQAAYIRAALESAFAQTYRPLEIVVSDDASSDESPAIIDACVKAHANEDIAVIVNFNERNLGNCGNWERICSIAHGEWIFKFDGDDESEPERLERTMRAVWEMKAGDPLDVLSCGATEIDLASRVVGKRAAPSRAIPVGAMMAFSRACSARFPAVSYPRVMDDVVWANRARMLGGRELRLEEALVRYRLQSGVSGDFGNTREVIRRCHRTAYDELAQARLDLAHLVNHGAPIDEAAWLAQLDWQEQATRQIDKLVNDGTLREKLAAIRFCSPGRSLSGKAFLWLCLLPGSFGDGIIRWLARIRHWAKSR